MWIRIRAKDNDLGGYEAKGAGNSWEGGRVLGMVDLRNHFLVSIGRLLSRQADLAVFWGRILLRSTVSKSP